jgi:hypothetical protein
VKTRSADDPIISGSEYPNSRSAPAFQVVTRRSVSIVKIAKSVALSTINLKSSPSLGSGGGSDAGSIPVATGSTPDAPPPAGFCRKTCAARQRSVVWPTRGA